MSDFFNLHDEPMEDVEQEREQDGDQGDDQDVPRLSLDQIRVAREQIREGIQHVPIIVS